MQSSAWFMVRVRRGVILAATLVLCAGLGSIGPWAAVRAEATPARAAVQSPSSDPFYRVPPGLGRHEPGTVLRWRRVDVQAGPVPMASWVDAYQLLYRTTDATDRPTATVTTVLVPKTGPAPGGRHALLAVHDAEDSVDPDCAPSYQLRMGGQAAGGSVNLLLESTLAFAYQQLRRGVVIAIPDAYGPRSQFAVRKMEGHAALDSIRAAKSFPAAGLAPRANHVAMVGYSGGSITTLAAAELRKSYAPELDIAGFAAGGAPVLNRESVQFLDRTFGAGLQMTAAVALDRAFGYGLDRHLNDRGRHYRASASKGCATSEFSAPFRSMDEFTKEPRLFDRSPVKEIVAANAFGHHTPDVPGLIYHGVNDEILSVRPVDKLVPQYCAGGARLHYFRDPVPEHIAGGPIFFAHAVPYLDKWLAGRSAGIAGCRVTNPDAQPFLPAHPPRASRSAGDR